MSKFTREEIIKRADLERDYKRIKRKNKNNGEAFKAYMLLNEYDHYLMKKYNLKFASEFFMELM